MSSVVAIRVKPRAAKAGLAWAVSSDGRDELEVRVTANPEGGAANEAVVTLIAGALGISRSEVTIISGHTSRHKRVALPYGTAELRDRLAIEGKENRGCSK